MKRISKGRYLTSGLFYAYMDNGKRRKALSRDMDGQIFCSCKICTSTIHGGRMSQGAMDGGVTVPGMDGNLRKPWMKHGVTHQKKNTAI